MLCGVVDFGKMLPARQMLPTRISLRFFADDGCLVVLSGRALGQSNAPNSFLR
jgi:hypothetical protein